MGEKPPPDNDDNDDDNDGARSAGSWPPVAMVKCYNNCFRKVSRSIINYSCKVLRCHSYDAYILKSSDTHVTAADGLYLYPLVSTEFHRFI